MSVSKVLLDEEVGHTPFDANESPEILNNSAQPMLGVFID